MRCVIGVRFAGPASSLRVHRHSRWAGTSLRGRRPRRPTTPSQSNRSSPSSFGPEAATCSIGF
eukprot:228956-Alexandrium_andersonii.AAC.1